MNKLLLSALLMFFGCSINMNVEKESPESVASVNPQKEKDISINQVVQAACGQCQFGMTEKMGCDLAVKIEGNTYFVDGTAINEHGDPHADEGFCVAIRHAHVKGKVIDGRFESESFTLVK